MTSVRIYVFVIFLSDPSLNNRHSYHHICGAPVLFGYVQKCQHFQDKKYRVIVNFRDVIEIFQKL